MSARPDSPLRPGQLLRYRPWRGTFRGPLYGMLAIARASLGLLFRRRLFWVLYGFSVLIFAFYFFGQYLQVFIETQLSQESVRLGSGVLERTVKPGELMRRLSDVLKLNGSADTFGNFIWTEGYIVVIVMALAGSVLVGGDFQHNSLPFYLSKPIGRWHYAGGKALAVGAFVHLMTTVPALVLFGQYALITPDPIGYVTSQYRLLLGILGYGLVMSVVMSAMVVALSTWLRQTVPMVMVWTTLVVFARDLARWLVESQRYAAEWRLIDVWNDLYLVGVWCLGGDLERVKPQPQPAVWQAAVTLVAIVAVCALYLRRRVRAVEVVR